MVTPKYTDFVMVKENGSEKILEKEFFVKNEELSFLKTENNIDIWVKNGNKNMNVWYTKPEAEFYCDSEGKILGKVVRDQFESVYRSFVENRLLGIYIEMNFAKSAVEKHFSDLSVSNK